MKKTIGIFFGGKSVEHDVSIITALQIYKAIDKTKYLVEMFYITKENKIVIGKSLDELETFKENKLKAVEVYFKTKEDKTYYFQKGKKPKQIDVAINATHGKGVEDGTISALLEFNNLAYTSNDLTESTILQNKGLTKLILEHYKIPVLDYEIITKNQTIKTNLPIIIKPLSLGSSIGINVIKDLNELEKAIIDSLQYEEKLIIEPFLTNKKEFSVAIYEINQTYKISTIEETINEKEIYTFNEKYINKEKKKLLPALINETLTEEIKTLTKKIYKKLSLKGVIRIDYLYDLDKEKLYVNEINAIPGSFSYYLFEKEGIPFNKLIDDLIKQALINKEKRKQLKCEYKTDLIKKQGKIQITK